MGEGIVAYIGETIQLAPGQYPKSPALDQNMYMAMALLQKHGFPNKIIPYCLAQILHENNNFQSRITQFWNWAGIKLSPWAKQNVDAFDAGNGYAGYRNLDGFAENYKRVLQIAPGKPFYAQSAQQFLDGLYKNHYFGDSYANYSKALNAKLRIVNNFLSRLGNPNSQISVDVKEGTARQQVWNDRKGITDFVTSFTDLKEWQKVGIFAAVTLIAITAIKR